MGVKAVRLAFLKILKIIDLQVHYYKYKFMWGALGMALLGGLIGFILKIHFCKCDLIMSLKQLVIF